MMHGHDNVVINLLPALPPPPFPGCSPWLSQPLHQALTAVARVPDLAAPTLILQRQAVGVVAVAEASQSFREMAVEKVVAELEGVGVAKHKPVCSLANRHCRCASCKLKLAHYVHWCIPIACLASLDCNPRKAHGWV